ncbi:hypothetical protein H7X87_03475 [Acetobacteraceae bacterium]|nr:hypothetical protein [Candidatus Parcubacteria bacterium]
MKDRNPLHFFDKLEDNLRARLSHRPILYAFVGGIGIVLFWKGVWETAEHFPTLYGWPSAVLGLLLILPTGLFVSFFIGDNIILSGYTRQKKLVEKTEAEIIAELDVMHDIKIRLEGIERDVREIKSRGS